MNDFIHTVVVGFTLFCLLFLISAALTMPVLLMAAFTAYLDGTF